MTQPTFRYLKELPNLPHRLGRHQVHDVLDAMPERQLEHVVDLLEPIKTVTHLEHVPVFDQGELGSCTANAAYGVGVTGTAETFAAFMATFEELTSRDMVAESDCVDLYKLETKIDDSQIPGAFPPDDTGSTGAWSMMAMEQLGLVKSFMHTRSLRTALGALNTAAISVGIPWYRSMFNVDDDAFVIVDRDSDLAGGHQICLPGQNAEERWCKIRQSWGDGWGDKGHARIRWDDLKWLFAQGGDAVQPRLT